VAAALLSDAWRVLLFLIGLIVYYSIPGKEMQSPIGKTEIINREYHFPEKWYMIFTCLYGGRSILSGIYDIPAKLKPAYVPFLWGGTLLRDALGKDIPADDIGESWEVSAHPRAQSIIASGPAMGMTLSEYAAGRDFYGCNPPEKFPLLIKFLGPKDNLSVQVHPSDGDCNPGESGKAEAWYVVACPVGAELIYGINGSKEDFAQTMAAGDMESSLRRLAVRPGDVLDIPAGMVHALTAGVVVYEVQQNSDTTYRLYDWGRVDAATGKPRALHIGDALRVIRSDGGRGPVKGVARVEENGTRMAYIRNPRFTLEKIEICGSFTDAFAGGFAAYSVIRGGGSVMKDGKTCFDVSLGDSFISPAAAGAVRLEGDMALLKAYVP
jgi:mannose-6-phosphate isomerase